MNYKSGKMDSELLWGIPSESAIQINQNYINDNFESLLESIHAILLRRKNSMERSVYSVYKATSYYINLAYKVFKLFDNKFVLSDDGNKLSTRPYYPCMLSQATASILFNLILREDADFFIPLCNARKLTADKSVMANLVYSYLRERRNVNKFDYGKSSLINYIDVRLVWINELKVLDKNLNIRKGLIKYILSNKEYKYIYDESRSSLNARQMKLKKYSEFKSSFLASYKDLSKSSANPDGFVNLYDIMEMMHLRYSRFQFNLNSFFENEYRNNYYIFAANIVTSIDNRKRFNIAGTEALLIRLVKIKN